MPQERPSRRNTIHTAIILRAFAADGESHYGRELHKATGLGRQAVQQMLHRFAADGWIEPVDGPQRPGNAPPREWYRITDLGLARAELASQRLSSLNEPFAQGTPSRSIGLT